VLARQGSVQSETFKVMERRLLRLIINPAMIATWLLGLWLAWQGPDSHYGWFNFEPRPCLCPCRALGH
jgi:putative membrane protein